MHQRIPILLLLLAAACTPAPAPHLSPSTPTPGAQLAEMHERYRVGALQTRRFTHAELWTALEPTLAAAHLHRERIGESAEGRPLYLVRYGTGPVPVLLWSQMHGDESTASMTLADLIGFFGAAPDDPLARRIGERLSVWMIPMLNPDGAERFQRRNAQGIDINRDAREMATPEGRALRAVQGRLQPAFGFNLHDQNVRIPVEGTERIAAIALLAPPFDESRSDNEVRLRAARLAAVLRHAAEPLVGGHIARYDDTYNPRAFGDGMQRWGTSTVLIESGAWRDDPEKQYLRRVHFVMLLTALDAIATGSYADADPAGYRGLPFNGRPVNDLLVRGGTVVAPGLAPFRADLAIDFLDALARRGGRIVDVGDLREASARDTVDASGLHLHLDGSSVLGGAELPAPAVLGSTGTLTARRGADPTAPAVWRLEAGRIQRAPSTHH